LIRVDPLHDSYRLERADSGKSLVAANRMPRTAADDL